jgi:hypothetical protein
MIRSVSSRVVTGLLCVAQLVIDQPEAFTRSEQGVALPSLPGPNTVWLNVWIEKKHRRIDMGQIAALPRQLLLELAHRAR